MVFVSAGHHIKDSGAIGVDGRKEADEAIKMRNAVVKYCLDRGLKVITDNDNETLSQYLMRIKTGNGSVVLEIHFDAFNKLASGTTALVGDDADRLDKLFGKEMVDFTSNTLGIKNRGVISEAKSHRGKLGLMREQGIVCLIEVCFIDNFSDMTNYDKNFFSLASGYAAIIEKFEKLIE
jgi:N-acetylmuramoyl-L-alanine amidase